MAASQINVLHTIDLTDGGSVERSIKARRIENLDVGIIKCDKLG